MRNDGMVRCPDPLGAIPTPADGCRLVTHTEGRLKALCGGHLFALYMDGAEDCDLPLILDERLLPGALRENGQYIRLVIDTRGEEKKP